MKIVKQFEDFDFLVKVYDWRPLDSIRDKWVWGLGDDGGLYFQCSLYTEYDSWHTLSKRPSEACKITIKEMNRIVKHFGHLLVFT